MREAFIYKRFIDEVAEAIGERFGEGFSVQFYELIKDGDTVVPAAAICAPGATTSVAVHIGQLLESLECEDEEAGLADAAGKVVSICEEVQNVGSYVDVIMAPGKRSILRHVTYQLVNTEKNARRLSNLPHKELLDISAVYRVTVKDNGIESAGIIVDNETCERFGISESELDNAADLNTDVKGFRTQPFSIAFPELSDEMGIDASHLWVLANRAKQGGAVVMLYPTYFGKLARRLGKDLYVMVSPNCGEVVAAPVGDGVTPDSLKRVVSRLDGSGAVAEAASKNVYRYRRRTRKWEIVCS